MTNLDSTAIDKAIASLKVDKLKTAIYARKSTRDETKIALETQIIACEQYIASDSRLKLIKSYSEDNVSGYHTGHRKQFKELLEEVRKGNIDVIVAYSLDRISRNIVDGTTIDQEFEKLGVLLLYATQSFENTAMGNFQKNILRSTAQFEPEQTSEKTLANQLEKAKLAQFNGGRILYGYKVVARKLVINEQEAKVVKMMFKEAASGSTIPDIVSNLTALGHLNRSNKPFPTNSVYNILKNEKYTGLYLFNKEGGRVRKSRVSRAKLEEVRIENGIPKIVSKEIFDKANSHILKKSTKKSAKAKNQYLLTGYLQCSCCGKKMHGEASVGGHSRKHYRHYTGPRKSTCKTRIRKEYIERTTAEVIAAILNNMMSSMLVKNQTYNDLRGEIQKGIRSLNTQIQSTNKELKIALRALGNANSNIVIEQVNNEIQDINSLKAKLEASKNDLDKRVKVVDSILEKYDEKSYQISADDILKNEELFNRAITLFINDVTIIEDIVEFNLKDLTD